MCLVADPAARGAVADRLLADLRVWGPGRTETEARAVEFAAERGCLGVLRRMRATWPDAIRACNHTLLQVKMHWGPADTRSQVVDLISAWAAGRT